MCKSMCECVCVNESVCVEDSDARGTALNCRFAFLFQTQSYASQKTLA